MGVYPPYVLKTQTWEFQNLHLTGLIFQKHFIETVKNILQNKIYSFTFTTL
jgi:hypothetical protein